MNLKTSLLLSRSLGRSLALLAAALTLQTLAIAGQANPDLDADYDRLDGKGRSGKRVDVIEWEGNLEIHVYPKGGLKGLALKLDERNKKKPVMVIGYRFENFPKEQLIRRAILGIELKEGFKAFREPSEPDYDKIIVSNNGLASQNVVSYRLEPEPSHLYPEGHPALHSTSPNPVTPSSEERRSPAQESESSHEPSQDQKAPHVDEETGTIQPFFMRAQDRMMNRR